MSKLSFNGKRIVIGFGLLLSVLCVANYYLHLSLLGRFGKHVMIATFIALVLFQAYVGPTFTEVREYRDKKRGAAPPRS
jgi:DMSO/TMAO reductase YedYZ heme-binding membrane subunit